MNGLKQNIVALLRWSERYTKTDMVYLARGGSLLSLGQIISSLAAFLLSIAFANFLPKEVFGAYKYALSIASILAIPTLQGLNTAVTQAAARGYEGVYGEALKTKLRWGTLSALGGLLAAGYYFFQNDLSLSISFLIIAVFLPFLESFGVYSSLLNGRKKFGVLTKYTIISQVVSGIILASTIILTDNLHIILIAYFAPLTILYGVFFAVTKKNYQKNDLVDAETLSYGKHLSIMGVINTIANYFDRIVLFQLLGAAPLAMYIIASAPINQIKGGLNHIKILSIPQFAGKDLQTVKQDYWRKFLILLGILTLGTIMYVLAVPFVFKLIFPQYLDSIVYSQILALSLISYVSILNISLLQAKKARKELYRQAFLAPTIRIALLLIGIMTGGMYGLIVAHVVARLWYGAYSTWQVFRIKTL